MPDNEKITFSPIGIFHCSEEYRYDTPRQGVFADGNIGVIELAKGQNFEQALKDLDGVERIWLLFVFHNNSNWKAQSSPPVAPNRKIGVFATRSPYRPNPVGLSCVELIKIEKLKIYVRNFDLLDNTPILDIKPYIPVADSFPGSRVTWLEEAKKEEFSVAFSPLFEKQSEFILQHGNLDVKNFCKVQLSINPLDGSRKRLQKVSENTYIIAFRTWRIIFTINFSSHQIDVCEINSAYTQAELLDLLNDKYNDKKVHLYFKRNIF